MTFTFDEEATREAFAHASATDLHHGLATLYAVVCIGTEGETTFSHGGQLTLNPLQALEVAREANEVQECRYIPVALGLDPHSLFQLANLVAGAAVLEEPDLGENP